MNAATEKTSGKVEPTTLAQFLSSTPPSSEQGVKTAVTPEQYRWKIELPAVLIHCSNKICSGQHWFDPADATVDLYFGDKKTFTDVKAWKYICRHCRTSIKTYAVLIRAVRPESVAALMLSESVLSMSKIGELPTFGVPAPQVLKGFLKDDAELFEKGRKSEAEGLGIGAFTYYRRIVDNQKAHLIGAVRSVAQMDGGSNPALVAALADAEAADGFTRAYEALKGHMPASLRISGHDPLQLLYDQTSHGLHNLSDAECLARAATIREVMSAMAARVQELLRSHEALARAVGQLSNFDTSRPVAASAEGAVAPPERAS